MTDFDIRQIVDIAMKNDKIIQGSIDCIDAIKAAIRRKYPSAQISSRFQSFDKNTKTTIASRRNNLYVRIHNKVYPILFFWLVKKASTLGVNNNLVNIWKRIRDLEKMSEDYDSFGTGTIIVLSNDKNCWKKHDKETAIACFSLHDHKTSDSDNLSYSGKKRQEVLEYKYGPYEFEWSDSCVDNFRYLVIGINGKPREVKQENKINGILDAVSLFSSSEYGSVFYRGQAGFSHVPLPVSLRHDSQPDFERSVFAEVITQHPDEYINIDNLQKLSRMQHGEIPTRMMDVSLNPLVSLFFAVSGLHREDSDERRINKEKSCWLFSFTDTDSEVRSFDSDTCRCISALPYLSSVQQRNLRYEAVMEHFLQSYCRWLQDTSLLDSFHGILDVAVSSKSLSSLKNDKYRIDGEYAFSIKDMKFSIAFIDESNPIIIPQKPDEALIDCIYDFDFSPMRINKETEDYDSYEMLVLDGKISREIPAFRKCIHPLTLLNGVFVRPVSNSDRMIAQQGAFMLYGLSYFWNIPRMTEFLYRHKYSWESILQILITNDRNFLEHGTDKKCPSGLLKEFASFVLAAEVYEVDFDKKERIKEELSALGINKETMGRSEITTSYHMQMKQ